MGEGSTHHQLHTANRQGCPLWCCLPELPASTGVSARWVSQVTLSMASGKPGRRQQEMRGSRDVGSARATLCKGDLGSNGQRQGGHRGHEAGHGQCSIHHLTGEVERRLCGGKQGQAESIYILMKNKNVVAQVKTKGRIWKLRKTIRN